MKSSLKKIRTEYIQTMKDHSAYLLKLLKSSEKMSTQFKLYSSCVVRKGPASDFLQCLWLV